MLGHSKEIISADVYGDTAEIIEDCLYAIEPFMEEVLPESREEKYYDLLRSKGNRRGSRGIFNGSMTTI